MKNDTNSWDETLRQRLLEVEQESDYPVWNAQRVWEKAQQQLAENQIVISNNQSSKRTVFWYALAASWLLLLRSHHLEIRDMKVFQNEKVAITTASSTTTKEAQKENIKHFFIKKEKKKRFLINNKKIEPSIYPSFEAGSAAAIVGNTLPISQNYIENLATLNPLSIPALEIRGIDFIPHLPLPQKGNCTVLNLPLLREEKPMARFFRQLKQFNTDGTLPANVSNIPVLVERINQ